MIFYNHLIIMLLPLVISNVIHMVLVKWDVMRVFNVPIWESAFGKNKTWRGFIIITFLNAFFVWLFARGSDIEMNFIEVDFMKSYIHPSILLGALLGLAYLIFELPNSWIKRKLGIGAGELAQKPIQKWFFMFVDKSDSAIGVVLTYSWLMKLTLNTQVQLLAASIFIHISLAWLLYKIKIKSSI